MSDYTREQWDEVKALKPDPKPALEDKYIEQLSSFSGYERARRRRNGLVRGFSPKAVRRSVRPSGTAPSRPKGEGTKAAQERAQARREVS